MGEQLPTTVFLLKRCFTVIERASPDAVFWRDLPTRFGDFRVVHTRHMRWSKSGVWKRLFKHLSQDSDNEYAMIDSTIVRAHQHAAGARGRSKKQNASDAPKAG